MIIFPGFIGTIAKKIFNLLWKQELLFTGSLAVSNDKIGYSVAMNSTGERFVVGAPLEDTVASNNGIAYIFSNVNNSWIQEKIISGSFATSSNQFGYSVDISDSGHRIVASSIQAGLGRAYIFTSGTNGWIQEASLTGSLATSSLNQEDGFGWSVSINSLGDLVCVGAPNDQFDPLNVTDRGIVYIFRSGSSIGWREEAKFSGSVPVVDNTSFGWSVALNSAGDRLVVGDYDARISPNGPVLSVGAAHVYLSSSTGWYRDAYFTSSAANRLETGDEFGYSVDMNDLGDIIAVGATRDETANYATDGSGNRGAVWVFKSGSNGWKYDADLTGTGSSWATLGNSVKINGIGDRILAGAYTAQNNPVLGGLAYSYISSSTTGWIRENVFSGSLAIQNFDNFGYSVTSNKIGNITVVSAIDDEIPPSSSTGIVYLFNGR
jgi:hypothetical protein